MSDSAGFALAAIVVGALGGPTWAWVVLALVALLLAGTSRRRV